MNLPRSTRSAPIFALVPNPFPITLPTLSLTLAVFLAGCAGLPGLSGSRPHDPYASSPSAPPPTPPAERRSFGPDSEIDRLVDAKPLPLPSVTSVGAPVSEPLGKRPGGKTVAAPANAGGGSYAVQIEALEDIDAAQQRQAQLEAKLGRRVTLSFDAPYYKLRLEGFKTRQEAEEQLLELSQHNLGGFIIRQ